MLLAVAVTVKASLRVPLSVNKAPLAALRADNVRVSVPLPAAVVVMVLLALPVVRFVKLMLLPFRSKVAAAFAMTKAPPPANAVALPACKVPALIVVGPV